MPLGCPPNANAVKSFPIEYPAVLALATDFVTSVASAKTAGTPDNMCLKPFTALPKRPQRQLNLGAYVGF